MFKVGDVVKYIWSGRLDSIMHGIGPRVDGQYVTIRGVHRNSDHGVIYTCLLTDGNYFYINDYELETDAHAEWMRVLKGNLS